MSELKALVVDDSAFMRKMISRILENGDGIKVIDSAVNGKVAYDKIVELKPDVVTLDIEMPVMDGLSLLKKLKEDGISVKVVVISAITESGSKTAMQALELGAMDVVHKPSGSISMDIDTKTDEIRNKIKAIAHLKDKDVNVHLPDDVHETVKAPVPKAPKKSISRSVISGKKKPSLFLIGISTGGPRALRMVFPQIPADFPLPILLVQHIPRDFVRPFAESLDEICKLNVREAQDGDEIKKGNVYIAQGERQMGIVPAGSGYKVKISEGEPVSGHMPSADYMFDSVLELTHGRVVAALMTGMGSDGAKALKRLHSAGAYTIAQDKKTSTVYGMPRVAVGLEAADEELPLDDIIPHVVHFVEERCKHA